MSSTPTARSDATALAAASLGNGADALRHWIARAEEIKPGVHMPSFDMLADEDLTALARYLEGLR